ncbi:hypothetical protein BD289DRAFT_247236 [Coniella lustricola]|uniref:Uncharacterized protein n=1 Tax=Coniella lustricola TaxID=2025994 RepID=A0A2T3A8Q6_9PEZI|nr:hypothetical protein BD289DRAFT_247236 [Coniella lustricola]
MSHNPPSCQFQLRNHNNSILPSLCLKLSITRQVTATAHSLLQLAPRLLCSRDPTVGIPNLSGSRGSSHASFTLPLVINLILVLLSLSRRLCCQRSRRRHVTIDCGCLNGIGIRVSVHFDVKRGRSTLTARLYRQTTIMMFAAWLEEYRALRGSGR